SGSAAGAAPTAARSPFSLPFSAGRSAGFLMRASHSEDQRVLVGACGRHVVDGEGAFPAQVAGEGEPPAQHRADPAAVAGEEADVMTSHTHQPRNPPKFSLNAETTARPREM